MIWVENDWLTIFNQVNFNTINHLDVILSCRGCCFWESLGTSCISHSNGVHAPLGSLLHVVTNPVSGIHCRHNGVRVQFNALLLPFIRIDAWRMLNNLDVVGRHRQVTHKIILLDWTAGTNPRTWLQVSKEGFVIFIT